MASTPVSPPGDLPIIVRDRRRKGFFTIDNELLDRFGAQLKAHGLAVYMALARFANHDGTCWPSLSTIAKRTGMSRMQVIREIAKLQELQLIAVEHQCNEQGVHRSNLYTLLDISEVVTDSDQGSNTQLPPLVTDSDHPSHRELPKQHTEKKTQHKNKTRKTSSAHTANNNKGVLPVVVALTDQGISERVAKHLAKQYSEQRIAEKIAFLTYLQAHTPEMVKHPQGWLRKAIEEDYAAPDGYQSEEERAAQKVAAQQQSAEMERIAQERQQQEQAIQERHQQEVAEQLAQWHQLYGTTQREIDLWKQFLGEFKGAVPSATFFNYVVDTVLLSFQEGKAVIGLPNPHARDWMENRFTKKIERTLSSYFRGQKITVTFVDLAATSA